MQTILPGTTSAVVACRRVGAAAAMLSLLIAALLPPRAAAHPGTLDEYGGHFDEKTGVYHYHDPKADLVQQKKQWLRWVVSGQSGEVRGTVQDVARPDAVWVRVGYRPAYQDFVEYVAPSNRDDKEQWLKVFFRFVSPEASVNQDREYNEWFHQKVIYELKQKLVGKPVNIQFRIMPGGRLYGMVFHGEENVNLWLVLNGWSYTMLSRGENPYEKLFHEAEEKAREEDRGLWKRVN